MLKIAIVGPESSGKTTLSEALARTCGMPWAPEFARAYLDAQGGAYSRNDLLTIALGQCAEEDARAADAPAMLFCDTDMITIRIWSEEKFGACDTRIVELTEQRHYDHWLLCRPDIPWEPDPLRENPHDRDRLFVVYEKMLNELGKPYTIIEGDRAQRIRQAKAIIDVLEKGPLRQRSARS